MAGSDFAGCDFAGCDFAGYVLPVEPGYSVPGVTVDYQRERGHGVFVPGPDDGVRLGEQGFDEVELLALDRRVECSEGYLLEVGVGPEARLREDEADDGGARAALYLDQQVTLPPVGTRGARDDLYELAPEEQGQAWRLGARGSALQDGGRDQTGFARRPAVEMGRPGQALGQDGRLHGERAVSAA